MAAFINPPTFFSILKIGVWCRYERDCEIARLGMNGGSLLLDGSLYQEVSVGSSRIEIKNDLLWLSSSADLSL